MEKRADYGDSIGFQLMVDLNRHISVEINP